MPENERLNHFMYPDETEVQPEGAEVCASRNGVISRQLAQRAEVLGEIETVSEEKLALCEKMVTMREKMRAAFSWDEPRAGELDARILGDENEPSESLQVGLRELYLASKLSFLNENSTELITLFTREGLTTGEIHEYVQEEKYPKRNLDELYVAKRLVTILTELSTTYDG